VDHTGFELATGEPIAAVAAWLEGTPLFLMVETARGVLAAPELARAPHAAGLLFGAADFRANVRGSREPDEGEILVARSALVLAARAAGIEVFDTPHFEYRDEAGLEPPPSTCRSPSRSRPPAAGPRRPGPSGTGSRSALPWAPGPPPRGAPHRDVPQCVLVLALVDLDLDARRPTAGV
jgi:hypothetical protein